MNDSSNVTRERADLLARVSLLAGLERMTLAKLAGYLEPVVLNAGDVLFHQGDPGGAFYLVSKGSFGVHVAGKDGASSHRVATLRPGDPVGEMALLTNQARTATIMADDAGEVLKLDRARFLDLVHEQPSVALAIAATLSLRLAAMISQTDGAKTGSSTEATPASEAPAPAPERKFRMSSVRGWRPGRLTIAALLAGGMLAAGWIMAPPAGLSLAGWHALATVLAVLPALVLNAVAEGVLALLLAAALVLGSVVPTNVALSGFASAGWVLVVSVLIIGAAMASSGLLYRLALWTVAKGGGGYKRSVVGLTAAGVLMSPAVPNATGRVIVIAPVLGELVEAMGLAHRSRAAAGLSMAALIGFGQLAAVFLTSSTTTVLVYTVLPAGTRGLLDWVTWAQFAAPTNLILFVGLIATILWLFRPEGTTGEGTEKRQQSLALQRALLGPMSRREWSALIIGGGLLLGFITQPLHGMHPAWVAVLALAALAVTRLVTVETLQSVNWSFALLFGMLASLPEIFSVTETDRWLARLITGRMGDLGGEPALFLGVVTLLCFAVSLVVRWQAAAPLITIALAPVAAAAGINPVVIGIVSVIACNCFFMPYQSSTYLALYHGTGGTLFSHAQARPMAVAHGFLTLFAVVASVPFWRMMGLL